MGWLARLLGREKQHSDEIEQMRDRSEHAIATSNQEIERYNDLIRRRRRLQTEADAVRRK